MKELFKNILSLLNRISENAEKACELRNAAQGVLDAEAVAILGADKPEKTFSDIKKLHDNRTIATAKKADALIGDAVKLERLNKIYFNNVQAMFAEYVDAVLKEVLTKYEGKKYGPKTKDAISAAAKEYGIGFYFDGSISDARMWYVKASLLGEDGYYKNVKVKEQVDAWGRKSGEWRRVDAEIYTKTRDYDNCFVTDENKINKYPQTVYYYKLIEDAEGRLRAIDEAFTKYAQALELAKKAEDEYNALLPYRNAGFDNVKTVANYKKF